MIRALGYTVEYGRGSFNKDHDSSEVMSVANKVLLGGASEPVLTGWVSDHETAYGVVLSLGLCVIVPDNDEATANVLAFLDRFEENIHPGLVTREFRVVDGVPSP